MMYQLKKINLFDFTILLYLYIPIIIFLLTWVNWVIGVPIAIISCFLIWRSLFLPNIRVERGKVWPFFLIALVIIVAWALLSGLGGFFQQSLDWQKHNVLLNDFVNRPWPVTYNYYGKYGVVSYYIGEYLLPGAIGKASNFNIAQDFLFLWITAGLLLLVFSLYKWIHRQSGWIFLLIVFGLIMFSPFIYPLNGIYANWVPADANYMGEMGEWFSRALKIQYTSNISLLRFVFPQFVPVAIVTSLWLRNRYNYALWGVFLAPLVLYSTFTFIGMGILMFLTLLYDCFNKEIDVNWHKVVSLNNLLAFLVMIVLLLYIAANILQPKPVDVKMRFTFINFSAHKLGFITFQSAWLIWILLLLKYERKNPLIYITSILLFLLPFCEFGAANDLVMRVSIPALMIINFTVIKNIATHLKTDHYFSLILIGALMIAGAGPLMQLRDASQIHSFRNHVYNMPYKSGNKFFDSDKNVVYQYVDWSPNILREIIIRK